MDRSERKVILFRDVTCIVLGGVGLMQQFFIGPPNPLLVTPAMFLLLGPAGYAVWAQRNSGGQRTIEPSSGPPQEPQPQSSSPQ